MTTAPVELDFEEFWPKQVPSQQKQFTGFGDDDTGWDIVNWLREHGWEVYGREDEGAIFLTTPDRAEAVAYVGWWLVIDPDGVPYFIKPTVHDAKYGPVRS